MSERDVQDETPILPSEEEDDGEDEPGYNTQEQADERAPN